MATAIQTVGNRAIAPPSIPHASTTPVKKSYLYQERGEAERAVFQQIIARLANERFVYVDEAGIDDTADYFHGYTHQSKRYRAEKQGHKTQRVSFISSWRDGEVIAPMVFEGYCNSVLVCQQVEECLVPELLPGQIVLMDNASFHPKSSIERLVAQAGCEVIYLPKYSPNLNKIEKFWARLKQIRKLKRDGSGLMDAIREAFRLVS